MDAIKSIPTDSEVLREECFELESDLRSTKIQLVRKKLSGLAKLLKENSKDLAGLFI